MFRLLQSPRRCPAALCAAVLLAAGAANTGLAAYQVSVRFQVEAISFSATPGSPYITFPFLDVQGFTDPYSPDNHAELVSGGGDLMGWVRGPYSASSRGFSDPDLLKTGLDLNPWTLSITDGATAAVRSFNITVSSALLTGDYMRPITMLGGIDNGSTIAANHTFEWSMDATANPLAEYTDAYIAMYDPNTGNSYSSPPLTPADRSWTPDPGPIAPGIYNMVMVMSSNSVPQDLIVAAASASDGGEPLDSFSTSITAVTQMQLYDLHVIPEPGSIALLALGGFVSLRRRR